MTFIGGSFGLIPSEGGGGGGGVVYASSLQKSNLDRRSDDLTIPSGALFVEVVNMDIMGTINVNGKDILAGERWHSEAFINEVDRTIEFVEEVIILSTGVNYLFRVSYPGSSPVNPNTL